MPIYIQNGRRTVGDQSLPVLNFHVLTIHLGSFFAPPSDTRDERRTKVVCERCGAEALAFMGGPSGLSSGLAHMAQAFKDPCPRKDDP